MSAYLSNQPIAILLLGGRSPACLEWARLLHKLGHSVHVADSVSPFLTQFSNSVHLCHKLPPPAFAFDRWQDEITQIVKKHHIQLIIPTCEEVFYLAKACLSNAKLKDLSWIADFKTLMKLHDKFKFFEMVNESNSLIKVPQSYLIKQDLDKAGVLKVLLKLYPHLSATFSNFALSKAFESDEYTATQHHKILHTPCKWVFKPCLSRFATRTLICPTLSEVLSVFYNAVTDSECLKVLQQMRQIQIKNIDHQESNLETIDAKNNRVASSWIAQAYIEGKEMASYSMLQAGQLVAHTCYEAQCRTQTQTRKRASPDGNTPSQIGASLDFNSLNAPQVVDFARTCALKLNYTGQLGFDFIQDTDGVYWVLECNPRATSGIHLLAREDLFLAKLNYISDCYIIEDVDSVKADSTPLTPLIQSSSTHCSLKFAVVYELLKNPKLVFSQWQVLSDSKDVIFDKDDMRPVLGQFVASFDLLWQSWRHKKSILTMSTDDIKWDAERNS